MYRRRTWTHRNDFRKTVLIEKALVTAVAFIVAAVFMISLYGYLDL
jgi:hypothetical protein